MLPPSRPGRFSSGDSPADMAAAVAAGTCAIGVRPLVHGTAATIPRWRSLTSARLHGASWRSMSHDHTSFGPVAASGFPSPDAWPGGASRLSPARRRRR